MYFVKCTTGLLHKDPAASTVHPVVQENFSTFSQTAYDHI